MNASTHSTCLKKIHIYLQSLVGHFYFIYFSGFVSFWDLFFSNNSWFEWRPCAIKFGTSYTCHVYPQTLFRFHSHNVFVCRGTAGLSGCCGEWVHVWSVGEKINAYWCLFLYIVQYGTRGKCPSFCCEDFCVTFLNCTYILLSIFNWTLQSIPFGAVTWKRAGTADTWISTSAGVGFGLCQVGSKCV